jgi:hypothetical protein
VSLRTCLFAASLAVLVAGSSAGLALVLTADEEPEATASSALLLSPGSSKTYVRDLRRFGGKAAVLFDEFLRWFDGLWEGRTLGKTVIVLTALASLGLFLVARKMPR